MIDKIVSYYEDALKIKSGVLPVPRMAVIYPTYVCNFKCSHCMYQEMKYSKKNYPLKKLKRLVNELADFGVKAVVFCGGGEPMMYPHFKEIIKYISKRGLEFGIISNGSLLGKYYKLLIDNSRFVRITVDSVDKENYDRIHHPFKGFTVDNVIDNIRLAVGYRNKTNNKCSIGVKTLLSKYNLHEKDTIEKIFKDIGVNYVSFKEARKCEGELENLPPVVISHKCFMSPIQTMIDAYGDVFVCSFYQYRQESHKFGNVMERPFKEVWYSSEHLKAIENIKTEECAKYECKLNTYNNLMHEILTKDPEHINFF
jgi:radical SAM protein with 4Fe4S-binding SPASM domain